MATSTWTLLNTHDALDEGKKYFVKYEFNSDHYSLSLTDFSHIWSESLNSGDIFRKAYRLKTKIDPREDPSQLHLLLLTIQKPLKGDGDVEVLRLFSTSHIELKVVVKLPQGLGSLEWIFELSLQPEDTITKELVGPIWLDSYEKQKQMDDLIKRLAEKDHVISKLLESIESAHIELASIFPSTAGLRSLKSAQARQDQAGAVVSGLAPFSENEWRSRLTAQRDPHIQSTPIAFSSTHLKAIASAVGISQIHLDVTDAATPSGNERKVQAISDGKRLAIRDHEPARQISPAVVKDDDETEDEEDDAGFQRQSIPPHLKQHNTPPRTQYEHASSPAPIVKSRTVSPLPAPASKPKKGKLGKVGGAARKPEETDSETSKSRSNQEVGNITEQPKVNTKKRLGKVGASKKLASSNTEKPGDKDSDVEAGATGSVTKNTNASEEPEDTAVSQLTSAKSDHPNTTMKGEDPMEADVSKETPQQLAERRREELKRRLEMEQRAPAKKKKRF